MDIKLNLLPPYRKEEMRRSERFRSVIRFEVIIFFILVIFSAVVYGFNLILDINYRSTSLEIESGNGGEKYQEIKNYDQKFKDINVRMADVEKINNDQLYWSKLLLKFSELASDGIKIKSFSTQNYAISLEGEALSRDDLIALKEKFDQESCFSNVNLPLSNLVLKENIDFQMNFSIKDYCVKNQ